MFLSSLNKHLVSGVKSALMPAAFRLLSSGSRFGLDKPQFSCSNQEKMAKERCNFKTDRQPDAMKDLKLERRLNPSAYTWEYPAECCNSPCPDLLPRFDSLYYKPSDKAKRQYQQTWVECKPQQKNPRKVCCYDPPELPPIIPRKKTENPKTACPFNSRKMATFCSMRSGDKCPHTTSLGCRQARYPPSCNFTKPYEPCKKKCCPYPSYSECCHPRTPPLRTTECSCNRVQDKCGAYEFLRRKLMYTISPPLPAWPPKLEGKF